MAVGTWDADAGYDIATERCLSVLLSSLKEVEVII
jgi:hypothetical protein